MSVGFVNLIVLFGLIAVIIPPLIHLLNRQRYKVVDWGAMQFLQISNTKRRRLLLEELLLMLLRMGLIAMMVFALAAPFAMGPFVSRFASRPNRDVVLIFDNSASMGLDDGQNASPHEVAKEWAKRFLAELSPGDTITTVLAGERMIRFTDEPTHDLQWMKEKIEALPAPTGSADGPQAVMKAIDILQYEGVHGEQDIVVLTDGQRAGWFDANKSQWKQIEKLVAANSSDRNVSGKPRLWFVNVNERDTKKQPLPNYYWEPLESAYSQIWRYQPVRFKTTLRLTGSGNFSAPKLQLMVDGKPAGKLTIPKGYSLSSGRVPLSFTHQFTATGSHLLSVILKGDPSDDFLPADNRCDLAVMVQEKLPVLIVDGESTLSSESSTAAIRKAFSDVSDTEHPSSVLATTVPLQQFDPKLLHPAVERAGRPRVLVLADVPQLGRKQQQGIEQFLEHGGSVLVVIGERIADRTFYNQELFRNGDGWLPAKLSRVAGDRQKTEQAASIVLSELQSPLQMFREQKKCTLDQATFPQWWKVEVPQQSGIVLAVLTSGDPMLLEKSYEKGRVILCTVPLDHSWDSNLPKVLEYPVLMHELIYYLANTKAVEYNVKPGQALRFAPDASNEKNRYKLPFTAHVLLPDQSNVALEVENWPLTFEQTDQTGVYKISVPKRQPIYYSVEADRAESKLLYATAEQQKGLPVCNAEEMKIEPIHVALAVIGQNHSEDIWWCLMLLVVFLLCVEIWLTRRMVIRREGPAK